jgi:predicted Zn-dependent protease
MGYDDLLKEIKEIESTIKDLQNQIYVEHKIDKNGLHFRLTEVEKTGTWKKATVTFQASHGYYGNSSASDDMSTPLAKAIVEALEVMEKDIIKKAIATCESEKTKLAIKAKEEASKIIAMADKIV